MVRRYEPPKRPMWPKEWGARYCGLVSIGLLVFETVVGGLLMLVGSAAPGGHPPMGGLMMLLSLALVGVLSPIALLCGVVGLLLDDRQWLRWVMLGHVALMIGAQGAAQWMGERRPIRLLILPPW